MPKRAKESTDAQHPRHFGWCHVLIPHAQLNLPYTVGLSKDFDSVALDV